ncbi:hypothetical protein [Mesorhizobium loti]|uniref:Galactosyltransferase Lgt5 n=1 Tax=Mesorhizobium loti R88b TaxID=935548 RepID=A0A6M7WC23_RHILI|nr:hypothetical protein [Mesorhizobium loti]QKD01280.1 galactosyltransferase Lgt5 [Mesorhizobium loti R88b]
MTDPGLPAVHAIWIGGPLGPMHVACLKSFLRIGHRTVLHVYDDPGDAPLGVELADAAEILPRERIIVHRNGGYALFADIFRYKLLATGAEIYIDCDMFCVRPLERRPYMFGWESQTRINNAVLSLPVGSLILSDLVETVDHPKRFPEWYSWSKRLRFGALRAIGKLKGFEDMPHASIGPPLLTYLVRKHRLLDQASPMDVFYPNIEGRGTLLDPKKTIADLVTAQTRAIHLWHGSLWKLPLADVPPTSPLGEILAM